MARHTAYQKGEGGSPLSNVWVGH